MWQCAFCDECNEQDAQHCSKCGAHRPVFASIDDVRKIAPDTPIRIAGLRYWVFLPALVFFSLTFYSYSKYIDAKRIVSGYRADCSNLSATSASGVCYEIPAIYKFVTSSGPTGSGLVEITPDRQTAYEVTADPGSLPQSGNGIAIFWKGKLTALATPAGQAETSFSPVHLVHDQQSPIFCWFLIGFGATVLPFTLGYAFIIEPDVDDDPDPKDT